MTQSKKTLAPISLESAPYVRIAQHNGEELQLYSRPVDPADYEGTQLYTLTASRGKVKGMVEYFCLLKDYKQAERASRDDNILAQVASGKTPEQIVAEMVARAQARQAKKLAKA